MKRISNKYEASFLDRLKVVQPELSFLVKMCGPGEGNPGVPENMDWEKFYSILKRHRLLPFVANKLKEGRVEVPVNINRSITEGSLENQKQMLKYTGESVQLFNTLVQSDIPAVLLKGPLLALQLYGDVSYKQSRDIDILVCEEDIERAEAAIKGMGYVRIYPHFDFTKKQKRNNFRIKHHYQYYHHGRKILLELHWRLFTPSSIYSKPTDEIIRDAVTIDYSGHQLKILSPVDLLVHLAGHGAIHRWMDLFMLKDFSALLEKNICEWDLLERSCLKYGAINNVALALVLSRDMFGSSLPPTFLRYTKTANIRRLAEISMQSIIAEQDVVLTRKIKRFSRVFYLMRIGNSFRHSLNCIAALMTNPSDWEVVRLPDRFFFLYYLLRPFIWFSDTYIKRKQYNPLKKISKR